MGVDAPDFNLGIEQKLRRRGIPTVHFVSPAIWAWRPERIHQIRRAVDHMLLVFPFEQEIYKRAGIDATYVGHPLAGVIPMKPDTEGARRDYGLMEGFLRRHRKAPASLQRHARSYSGSGRGGA